MAEALIVSGVRTPIGALSGSLAEVSASDQFMIVFPSRSSSFARCWIASTSATVNPTTNSPRAMTGLRVSTRHAPHQVALRPRVSMWTKPDDG